MGIFSRLGDIINSNLNTMLDRAEDPEKIVRLAIQEMEDTLVEVRATAAKSIAEKKELTRRLAEMEAKRDEWEQKAEFALSKDREDLARGALLARTRAEETMTSLRQAVVDLDESLAKTNEDMSRLQAKLNEAKAKQKAMDIRHSSATGRVKMRTHLHDNRIGEALERYDAVERRLDELEGQAESFDLGEAKSLEQELAELEAQSRVDEDLARLRARLAEKKAGSAA